MAFVTNPPQGKQTADLWYEQPIQSISITPMGPFSATADGACQVALPDGDTAYAKPRPDTARNLVVAREKIASDLGYRLGLPVAPVVVRLPDPANGWNYYSALSLARLKGARLWAAGGAAHLDRAATALEELRVFWTWIGDHDHNGHGQNLLFAIQSGVCDVMAIDHAFSLCHGNQKDPFTVGVSQGYGTTGRADCAATAQDMVTKILSLDWDNVEKIVRRLSDIIAPAEQDWILRIFGERRGRLAAWFPSTGAV